MYVRVRSILGIITKKRKRVQQVMLETPLVFNCCYNNVVILVQSSEHILRAVQTGLWLTVLDGIHTTVSDLDGFIQGDEGGLAIEGSKSKRYQIHFPSSFNNYFLIESILELSSRQECIIYTHTPTHLGVISYQTLNVTYSTYVHAPYLQGG